jgi:hypothetical protein
MSYIDALKSFCNATRRVASLLDVIATHEHDSVSLFEEYAEAERQEEQARKHLDSFGIYVGVAQ